MSNREIKFRAFDLAKKKMIFCSEVHFNSGEQYWMQTNDVDSTHCGYANIAFSHPMQFTGLKDKLGKNIYESDIVKLYYKGVYRFCEIVFADGMFCLKWDDGYVNKYQLYPQSLEVVGNIYETKIK